MERISARAEFQPGLRFPARFVKPGWDFQPGLKLRKTSCNRIKISARAEKWAWACSVIVFSAKQDGGLPLFTAILNFTPGWNSPCNRPLTHLLGWRVKPRLQKQFFACTDNAIFRKFAWPACGENRMCSHTCAKVMEKCNFFFCKIAGDFRVLLFVLFDENFHVCPFPLHVILGQPSCNLT